MRDAFPYDRLWLYANLFLPVMRIKAKVQVPMADGKFRTRRVYDRARPPLAGWKRARLLRLTDRKH